MKNSDLLEQYTIELGEDIAAVAGKEVGFILMTYVRKQKGKGLTYVSNNPRQQSLDILELFIQEYDEDEY